MRHPVGCGNLQGITPLPRSGCRLDASAQVADFPEEFTFRYGFQPYPATLPQCRLRPAPGPDPRMLSSVTDAFKTIAGRLRPADAATRLRSAIWWGVGSLLGVLWLLFAISTIQQLDVARRAAVSNTSTLARLIEAWALSTLGRIEDVAVAVEPHLERTVDRNQLAILLARQRRINPTLFLAIDVIGADGTLMATSAADAAHTAARNFDTIDGIAGSTLIGLPRQVGPGVQIPIQRTLAAPDGRTLGALIV
jgi:hypothetical protein